MSKISRRNKKKKCKKFKVYLSCGCCDATVFFFSINSIDAKFVKMGYTSSGVLTDDLGNVIRDVDTFAGYQEIK